MRDLTLTNTKYWRSITTYEILNIDKTKESYDSYGSYKPFEANACVGLKTSLLRGG